MDTNVAQSRRAVSTRSFPSVCATRSSLGATRSSHSDPAISWTESRRVVSTRSSPGATRSSPAGTDNSPSFDEDSRVASTDADCGADCDAECPICLEGFTSPITLDCSHTFCRRCLEKYYYTHSSTRTMRCPMCLSALSRRIVQRYRFRRRYSIEFDSDDEDAQRNISLCVRLGIALYSTSGCLFMIWYREWAEQNADAMKLLPFYLQVETLLNIFFVGLWVLFDRYRPIRMT